MHLFMTLLIILFISTTATAGPEETSGYERFYHAANISEKSEKVVLSWANVTTHGSTKSEANLIMSYVSEALTAAGPFFSQYGTTRCDAMKLNVFFIKDSLLNNQKLMNFISWEKWYYMSINGAYDGIYSPGESASIFISKSPSGKSVKQLVAHEVAHYWQDQHCGLPISEETAHKFEKYFMRSR